MAMLNNRRVNEFPMTHLTGTIEWGIQKIHGGMLILVCQTFQKRPLKMSHV